jgi:signal transduction histidine kinase
VARGVEYVHPVSDLWPLARRYGFDALIVVAAIESALEIALRSGSANAPRSTLWFAMPAAAVIFVPLLARRRYPFAAPAVVWLASAALSFADGRIVVFTASIFAAGMAAAFLLGNLNDARQAWLGLAIALGSATIIVYNNPAHAAGDFVFTPVLFAIAWLAGFALRERAEQAEAAEARAMQAERDRETAARIAVAEERARIARELHDIVAHTVSVMVLQVGAVRHKLPEALADEADALRGVEGTGRASLAEMRRLLGALRREGDDLELAPQPGLGRLDSLLAETRRAGLPVRLHVDGEPVPLPQAIDLSAYRIVQEGLTNALKHAEASQADVTVRYGPDELQIEVLDNGEGDAKSDCLGFGLIGVRERVKIYGGELTTGTPSEGGFILRARLPLAGDRP